MGSPIKDLSAIKGYILGVIAFAGAISGFCATVFGWDLGKVTAVTSVAAVVFISLAFLIQRAETRNMGRLEKHISESDVNINRVNESLDYLKDMAVESQRSTIRIEMNSFIRNEPWNHDTILAYAERYFVDLNGDWKETDRFLQWVDEENNAGRNVHIPAGLLDNVRKKADAEGE